MTPDQFDDVRGFLTSLESITFLPVLLWLTWLGNGGRLRLPGWLMGFAWAAAVMAALRGIVGAWELVTPL